jgi:hypothetical protein
MSHETPPGRHSNSFPESYAEPVTNTVLHLEIGVAGSKQQPLGPAGHKPTPLGNRELYLNCQGRVGSIPAAAGPLNTLSPHSHCPTSHIKSNSPQENRRHDPFLGRAPSQIASLNTQKVPFHQYHRGLTHNSSHVWPFAISGLRNALFSTLVHPCILQDLPCAHFCP